MKVIIASDIHGSEHYCRALAERFEKEQAERLFLLGDILYHGPRNDLPKDYSPKGVISILNPMASKILCIKGNCDSEVDGMVLDFPIEAEEAMIYSEGLLKPLYLTHGHKIRKDISDMNCILVNGHTHVPLCESKDGFLHINPGSVSIPKENSYNSCILFDGTCFKWENICTGEVYMKYDIK